MTSVDAALVKSSISPIDVYKQGDAEAPPVEEKDELGEGRKEGKKIETPIEEAIEQGEEEVRQHRVARRPVLPTKAEIDEHYPLHLNFRSWCEHCVAGKARLAQHIVLPADRERMGVTIHMDYAFLGSEEAEEGMQPTLVMFDDDKLSFWALAVRQKGATNAVVKYVAGILDQSGYQGQRITMKSDQEPSIVALKTAVAAARVGETIPIESPVRASKSNGKMENAIKLWQEQLRTIKHYTESKLKKRIEVDGAIFSWLVPYVSEILNKFKVGLDGVTAYERTTAHRCRHFVVGFCEVVDFILETDKSNIHKADSRVGTGVFLGYVWRSTEYLIGTKDGILRCRTIKRKAEEVSYDPSCTEYLNIRYDDYILEGASTTQQVSFPRGAEALPVPSRGRDFVPRRVYIMPADYVRHGYTQGCRGCTWAQNQLGARAPHSEACRARIEGEIGKDENDGRTKKVQERHDHFAATKVAEGDSAKEQVNDPRSDNRAQDEAAHEDGGRHANEDAMDADPSTPSGKKNPSTVNFEIHTPVTSHHEEDELVDAPGSSSDRRVLTPARKPAVKRKENIHTDEPDTKKIILDDPEIEQEVTSGMQLNEIMAKREDEIILNKAILGHSLHEVYSNQRIRLAVERNKMEGLNKQLASTDVCEMFSPERVTAVCKQYGLTPGAAMDIMNGYDFDIAADRKRCWDSIIKDEPMLVIGSPPCTMFSQLQELNKYMYRNDQLWMQKFQLGVERAKRHIRFCAGVYEHQRQQGRYFLHEHPWLATSWALDCIDKLVGCDDVRLVRTDMCQFGMVTRVGGVGSEMGAVLKPTGFLTNSPCISRELARRCPRDHEHVPLVGGRAAGAAVYPHRLCCAICKGVAAQIRQDKSGRVQLDPVTKTQLHSLIPRLKLLCCEATGGYPPEIVNEQGEFTLDNIQIEVDGEGKSTGKFRKVRPAGVTRPPGDWPSHWADVIHEFDGHGIKADGEDRDGETILNEQLFALYVQNGVEVASDDVSGAWLDPELVREGRAVEMSFFESMRVYDRVPRSEQAATGGKIIGTKWIDVNKGDFDNPRIRCRLVGK